MQIRAVVADDHPLFRSALKQAISEVLGESLLEAADFTDTLALLEQYDAIEVVFLDLNMPGNEGLTALSRLRHLHPDVLVVVVSAEERPHLIHKAIQLGASGYIPKSAPLSEIAEAVEKVLEGEQWVPEDMLSQFCDVPEDEQAAFAKRLEQLTPHQFTVLKMMADGLLNKQIAYELGVKETTIKQHGSAILRKLNVTNRTQAGVLFKQAMGVES